MAAEAPQRRFRYVLFATKLRGHFAPAQTPLPVSLRLCGEHDDAQWGDFLLIVAAFISPAAKSVCVLLLTGDERTGVISHHKVFIWKYKTSDRSHFAIYTSYKENQIN